MLNRIRQTFAGERVEVMGRIDAEQGDATGRPTVTAGLSTTNRDRSVGPDQIELPEFEVSTVREVQGTCPAKPSGRNYRRPSSGTGCPRGTE